MRNSNSYRLSKSALGVSLAALSFISLFPSSSPASAQELKPVTDVSVQEAINSIDAIAQKGIEDKTVVGLAIAVVHNDKFVFAKGYGLREVGTAQKVDADTVFQLASVSKPIAATVVAELVGEGKITWDSKISDLDPSFAMSEPWVTKEITIRDFFCHRSGWPQHAGDTLEDIGFDREQVLHRMRYQTPVSSFRSAYAYTNFGLTEAAVAASKAYGLTWETASQEKLFKPLHMNSTSARFADFMARPDHALGHVLVNGTWTQKYRRQPDAQSPAGGVSSSVNDMAQWMRLQLGNGKLDGKQIVSESALLETHKPQMQTNFNPLTGLPNFYGLGMNVSYDQHGLLHLSHSGAFAMGNATVVNMIPKEHLGIVVLTNSYPIGYAEGLAADFMDLVQYGKQQQDWIALFKKVFADPATLGLNKAFDYDKLPAKPSPALPNSAYIGTYNNNLIGPASVIEANGNLALCLGPNANPLPMKHYDRDVFTYLPVGENANGPCGINFTVDPNGKANAVTIEYFNEFIPEIFTRATTAPAKP